MGKLETHKRGIMKKKLRYVLESGYGPKGKYSYWGSYTSLNRAILMYKALNIGKGYKKRLRITWEELVWVRRNGDESWMYYREWVLRTITLLVYRS